AYSILPHALVGWVAMLMVTREGDGRCRLRPSRWASGGAGAPARAHSPRQAAPCGLPGWRGYRSRLRAQRGRLPAARTPSLTRALRKARPEYVLADGTVAGCDCV